VSFPILDEVVALMKARPKLRIGVYGTRQPRRRRVQHAPEQVAAAACVTYIVGKGIARDRLESEGFARPSPSIPTTPTKAGQESAHRVKMLNADAMEDD